MKNIFIFLFLFANAAVFAQKTDTIVHINGNILTGEIKRLDYGIISYKMDGMGTIKFQTNKIKTIISKKQFEIKLADGFNYFASIDSSNTGRSVKLILSNSGFNVDIDEINEIYPLKQNFWLRLSGKLSLGYSYNKGSGINNFNFAGNFDYRKRKSHFDLSWNSNFTAKEDSILSSKSDVSLVYEHYLKNHFSVYTKTSADHATEMGLELRMSQAVAGLYDLVYNHRNRLNTSLGLSGNREWSVSDTISQDNLEAFVSLNYKFYKYISPKLDISTSFIFYPSLTDKGRLRITYDLNSSIEVFNDFFVGLNYYYSFDSKPIGINSSNEDWGITTTFGYSFH
ncbi:MAG: hypothetical protein C0598_03995 [Marinilabiliales bacterium]|nr:MAG: hypothetical protein C0598_03995 [Marinilabiliales bacterium]